MYKLEHVIEHLTTCVNNAKADGRKRIHPRVEEMEDIISLLIDKSQRGNEPVKPVPNETLNCLGWHDMYNCGACGTQLRTCANFCDVCGRAVLKDNIRETDKEGKHGRTVYLHEGENEGDARKSD